MLNCAGGMNNKCSLDDWRLKLAYPVILLVDALLKIPLVANYLFERFATKESIKNILNFVYSNPEAVDTELVDLLHGHSQQEGYLDVFVSVITGMLSTVSQVTCIRSSSGGCVTQKIQVDDKYCAHQTRTCNQGAHANCPFQD